MIQASASLRGFIEGVDLADFAAEFAIVNAFVKEVHAVLADHASDFPHVWVVDLDLGVVAPSDAVHEIVGLFEETHRVEGGESGFGVDVPEHVEDRHAVDGEGRHLDGAIAKGVVGPLENLRGVSFFELLVDFGEFLVGEAIEDAGFLKIDLDRLVRCDLSFGECQVVVSQFWDGLRFDSVWFDIWYGAKKYPCVVICRGMRAAYCGFGPVLRFERCI